MLKAPLCVPWAVLTLRPCVVVVCVLNTCSPYPCHSGHRNTLHRRLPGLAQLAAQEHQEHELRQPRLPQDHGGRRRRNPHRATQRVHRPRVPSSEWQPQSAILSTSSRGRHHRQQFPLVLGGADALQQQMKGSLKYCRCATQLLAWKERVLHTPTFTQDFSFITELHARSPMHYSHRCHL